MELIKGNYSNEYDDILSVLYFESVTISLQYSFCSRIQIIVLFQIQQQCFYCSTFECGYKIDRNGFEIYRHTYLNQICILPSAADLNNK